MDYVFIGFRQTDGVRHYGFQGVAAGQPRTRVIIDADVNLLRKHSIALQDVPLMCRRLLESSDGSGDRRLLFTEEQMCRHADQQAAIKEAAATKRRQHRPPVTHLSAHLWRGPQK